MKHLCKAVGLGACIAWASHCAPGQSFQLVSAPEPTQHAASGGNGDSWAPIISPDGRYVVFGSTANNLLLLSNAVTMPDRFPAVLNVFLRDRTKQTTTLVSANLLGDGGGNGDSLPLAVSTNGQYVLFESTASDLVPMDNNGSKDIFVRTLLQPRPFWLAQTPMGFPVMGSREAQP